MGKVTVFDNDRELTDIIVKNLKRNGFQLHFQPIWNNKFKCFDKCEVFSRLYDEALGNIAPDVFLDILNKNKLKIQFDLNVLEKVCKIIYENKLEYIKFNINIGIDTLLNKSFINKSLKLLKRYFIKNSIIFELTEDVMVKDFRKVLKVMKIFGSHGVSFSLDDFGSGFSNYNYIFLLPFSEIKLDKSLSEGIDKNKHQTILVDALIKAVQQCEILVVIEGVENEEQWKYFEKVKYVVDYLQGYYLARPMDLLSFLKWIRLDM